MNFRTLAAGTALLALAGCGSPPPASTDTTGAAPLRPAASIIDIMDGIIDPAADYFWEAVATESTAEGTVEHRPTTDEEWKAVRYRVLQLVEAGNLLMMPGRVIAHPGQQLADEGTPGNLTLEQAEEALRKDHAAFVGFARAFQETALRALDAVERRDIDAYLQVGGELDETCEACHSRFWYPGAQLPPTQ